MTGETLKMKTIAVEMTEIEASDFVEYQRNRILFGMLLNAGVFSIKNGSGTLHFDDKGRLKKITTDYVLYDDRFGFVG